MTTVVLCALDALPEDLCDRVGSLLTGADITRDEHDGLHRALIRGRGPRASVLAGVRQLAGPELAWSVPPDALIDEGPALFVSDVDSTLITAEVIEEIAARAGTRQQVAAVTEQAMRGELDFGESLAARVATLAGVHVGVFAEIAAELELSPGAARLLTLIRSTGAELALVSGGFHEIVDKIADPLGIRLVRSNRLEVRDGRLTGRTVGAIVDREAKERHLRSFADQRGVPLERCVAIGDGANDLAMLSAAGLGIAYCAKPVVTKQTEAAIGFARLDAAYWLSVAH